MTDGVLYEDGAIKISYFEDSNDSYLVEVNGEPHVLPRGILEEIARSEGESGMRSKLGNSSPLLLRAVERVPVICMRFGLSLAQARIKELEYEVTSKRPMRHDYLANRARREKGEN